MKGKRRKNLSMLGKEREGPLTLEIFMDSIPDHKPIHHPGFLLEEILFLQFTSLSQDPLQEETQMKIQTINHLMGHPGGHQEEDPSLQGALDQGALEVLEHQEAQEGQGIPLTLETHQDL